jgi:hypothetical protein
MSTSDTQIEIIVKNIRKHGFLYEDDVIDFLLKRYKTFDKGLLVARVIKINENPEKFGLPAGTNIGSRPLRVDNKVKRIYSIVDANKFQHVDARKKLVKSRLKTFFTVPQAA